MDKNLVLLEGNVTRDVELHTSGKYCYVSVAAARNRGSGADFISVKAFGDIAKNCAASLGKGDRVFIEARVSSGSFTPEGAKDKVYRTDIVVDSIRKLAKGSSNAGASGNGFIDESASADSLGSNVVNVAPTPVANTSAVA